MGNFGYVVNLSAVILCNLVFVGLSGGISFDPYYGSLQQRKWYRTTSPPIDVVIYFFAIKRFYLILV